MVLNVVKAIRQLIIVLCALYLLSTLIGSVVYFFFDPNTSSIELIKTIFEFSLWLSIPVFALLLLLRAWRLAGISAFFAVLFSLIYVPLLIPRSTDIPSDLPRLTVMTFNLKATSEGVVDIIQSVDADIVALQELSQEGALQMQSLEDLYPYQALHPQAQPSTGQGILSRYPILVDEYWEYPDVPHTLGHQRIEIEFNEEIFVIYNTHPWPPLAWETGYNDESHRTVVQDIAQRVFAEESPLILVGDFNMTDSFEEYELLASQLIDSYAVAGDGIGYTFPNYRFEPIPPVLRLDYVWHSHHFASVEAAVWGDHAQSDHSPVVAELALLAGSGTQRN